jgi:hypothetical protein
MLTTSYGVHMRQESYTSLQRKKQFVAIYTEILHDKFTITQLPAINRDEQLPNRLQN